MKQLLLIHYHFLPVHNVAVARLLGYTRRLPDLGWESRVLSREWHDLHDAAPSWGLSWEPQLEAGSGCRIHRAAWTPRRRRRRPAADPAHDARPAPASGPWRRAGAKLGAKATRLARLAFGDHPDEFVGWVRPAVAAGLRLAREHPVDAIVSYCPPETNHLVARHLAVALGAPWVPFFGDLYGFLDPPLPAHSLEGLARRAWHRWCLAPAVATVGVSPAMVEYLARAYGKPSHLIHTGFDPGEAPEGDPAPPRPGARFLVSHVGSVYPGDQRPELLFDGLDRLLRARPEIGARLEVRLVGSKCEDRLRSLLAGRPSARVCSIRPKVDSATALSLVHASDALLVFTCTAHRDRFGTLSYPTKIFEAFGARKPVLAVPADGDWVDALLRETAGGVSARDATEVATTLLRWFDAWAASGRVPYAPRAERLATYTRERQAERLAALLDEAAARHAEVDPGRRPRRGPFALRRARA